MVIQILPPFPPACAKTTWGVKDADIITDDGPISEGDDAIGAMVDSREGGSTTVRFVEGLQSLVIP